MTAWGSSRCAWHAVTVEAVPVCKFVVGYFCIFVFFVFSCGFHLKITFMALVTENLPAVFGYALSIDTGLFFWLRLGLLARLCPRTVMEWVVKTVFIIFVSQYHNGMHTIKFHIRNVGQEIHLQCIHFHSFTFTSNKNRFNCTATRRLFHVVPTITAIFITSLDELLYSLLLEVHALPYRPSYHNGFHLAIFNSWLPTIYFSVGNGWQSLGEYFQRHEHNQCRFL
jgi:hypothetical protein